MPSPTIYHLVSRADWDRAVGRGRYAPPSLRSEGFVHCSTAEQLDAVAAAFYADVADLLVLDLDETELPVRWEPPAHPDGRAARAARADEPLFPHVYGVIELDAVVNVRPYVNRSTGSDRTDSPPIAPSG